MKSLDMLGDVVDEEPGLKSQFPRAITHKRARHRVVGVVDRNGRIAEHTRKDTSRQNRTPQSGQEWKSEGEDIAGYRQNKVSASKESDELFKTVEMWGSGEDEEDVDVVDVVDEE